jgi:hypothetical protein
MYPETLDGVNVKSRAEKLLFDTFKSQLSDNFYVLHSVAWIEVRRKSTKPSDGEIDFVIMHPRMGILLLEVKGGIIGRDEFGSWFSIRKDKTQVEIKNPFEQVKENKYALIKKIRSLPNWQYELPTIGHAVAFPDGNVDDLKMGVDIPDEIVLVHNDLDDVESWLRNCLKFWAGEKIVPPGESGVEVLRNLLKKSWYLREPKLGEEISLENALIDTYTEEQFALLDWLAGRPRAAIRGCAGSGKTLLALKKAEQLAKEGFRVLLTCYNRNLVEELREIVGKKPRIKVQNFHGLCQEYAVKTGRNLQPDWDEKSPGFFSQIMPDALAEASLIEDFKFDAIIVDEGQDFEDAWWVALEMLLFDQEDGVFYIFFDDNQLVYERKLELPLQEAPFALTTNCRNTQKIYQNLIEYYRSDLHLKCKGPEGREVRVNQYGSPPYDFSAILTEVLARLIYGEGVSSSDIVILSKNGLHDPIFGNSLRYGVFQLSDTPTNANSEIYCTTIRQFKGLERPIVILLPPEIDEKRYTELMYVGVSRASNHLEIIVNGTVGTD